MSREGPPVATQNSHLICQAVCLPDVTILLALALVFVGCQPRSVKVLKHSAQDRRAKNRRRFRENRPLREDQNESFVSVLDHGES